MGLFDWFARNRGPTEVIPQKQSVKAVVGAAPDAGENLVTTFNDRNITFSGDLEGYDYTSILRDKQNNITRLFE